MPFSPAPRTNRCKCSDVLQDPEVLSPSTESLLRGPKRSFQNQPRNSGRIPMVQGGGCQPSAAPRTPARAPRATRAYIWRAFPPETSGPATRPRRGLAPRRPGDWELYQLIARHTLAPSNRPSLLARPMRVQNYLGALASCAVRERQVARPVSRRRAARPTGLPIARNCGAR